MRPALAFGEARQEAAGGDRAGPAAADVVDVGEGGIEHALVFVPQRQLPGAVERGLAGIQQFAGEVVVLLGHDAGGVLAERHDHRAGQGGDVDQRGRLEALRIGQRVAQDQAAFGVGIAHFDGLAGHAGDHVGRAIGIAVDGVLDRGGDDDQVDRQLHADRGDEGAEHGAGAAHVVLHFLDAALGLQVDAAGVEGDALADQHVGLGVAAVAVLQHHQARALRRTARDREQRAHAERFHRRIVQHLALDLVAARGEFLRLLGQVGRVAHVRRQVAELAGELHAGGDGDAVGEGAALIGDVVAAGDLEAFQALLVALLVLGAEGGDVAVAGVVGGDDGGAEVPGGVAALHFDFAEGEQRRLDHAGLQRARGIAHRLDVLRHAELAGIAQPDHQHARRGDARQVVQQGGLAGLAFDVAALDQGLELAAAGGVDGGGGRGQAAIGVGADHHAIDVGGGGGGLVQAEFEAHRPQFRGKGKASARHWARSCRGCRLQCAAAGGSGACAMNPQF